MNCYQTLRNRIFYSQNQRLYCEIRMNELEPNLQSIDVAQQSFQTRQCRKCGLNFEDNQMISMYQSDCIRCVYCQIRLVNQGFFSARRCMFLLFELSN